MEQMEYILVYIYKDILQHLRKNQKSDIVEWGIIIASEGDKSWIIAYWKKIVEELVKGIVGKDFEAVGGDLNIQYPLVSQFIIPFSFNMLNVITPYPNHH